MILTSFRFFFDHLNDFECDNVIIGGDFNLVLNLDVDKKGRIARTHAESVKTLKELCAELDLVDAWQILNLDNCRYMWRRKHPEFNVVWISFLSRKT